MKRKLIYTLLFSTVIVVTGCGGGGGGGGASYINPNPVDPGIPGSGGGGSASPSPTVPFSTPQKIATIDPLVTNEYHYAIVQPVTADLKNDGTQAVIIAGRESSPVMDGTWKNSKLSVFGWNAGTFQDLTAQWFTAGENVIVGTEPSVKFGNFTGNGFKSMFIAPSSDGNVMMNSAQIFVNDGTKFTRKDVNFGYNIWSHDSTTFNWNGLDNIVALDYGNNSTFIMGSRTGDFRSDSVNNWGFNGSSIAAGNFLGDGSTTFVITDTPNNVNSTKLFGWAFDGNNVTVNEISTLPTPLSGHNVRAMAWNFDNNFADSALNGGTNVVIIGRASKDANGNWADGSTIQFLQNNGRGVFSDVTSQYVVGYDTSKMASYNPSLMDINNNGLIDIVLTAENNGTQVLMQSADHKFIASYANVISDFQNQVASIQGNTAASNGGIVTFVKGPSNNLYLLEVLSVNNYSSNTSQKAIYLSLVGNSANASATLTAIKQAWPYMNDATANAVLAATGKTWYGATIVDPQAALNPIGGLSVNTFRGATPISGYITGVNFGGDTPTIAAMDGLNRNYSVNLRPLIQNVQNAYSLNAEHIDQYELSSHSEYLISGAVNTYGNVRVGTETRSKYNVMNMVDPSQGPMLAGPNPQNYTFGIPKLYSIGGFSVGSQYTTLNYNPWMAFGGAWGSVTQTGNLDTSVRYNSNGFTAVVGSTYTTTQMMPGLINKVSDIYGVWAETGYRFANNVGVYAGVKPVVVSGSVSASLPTSVDSNGNVVYTGRTMSLQNQTTGYLRALWSTNITKKTAYRVSGTAMSNGQYRMMNELSFALD